MSVSSLKLSSAVIGVGGVATGAGVGIYQLIKTPEENKDADKKNEKLPAGANVKKKIKDLLQEKNKSILNKTGNDKKWKKNWEKFKENYATTKVDKKAWAFEETNSSLTSILDAPLNFKNKCESNKELDNSDDNKLLEEVLLYCTDNGESAK